MISAAVVCALAFASAFAFAFAFADANAYTKDINPMVAFASYRKNGPFTLCWVRGLFSYFRGAPQPEKQLRGYAQLTILNLFRVRWVRIGLNAKPRLDCRFGWRNPIVENWSVPGRAKKRTGDCR